VLHLGPIWGLTFVELKELRVAQGGREGRGQASRGAGGRVGVLVAYWWLGLSSPDYR
jgi:hypothetical protein